MYGIAVTNKLSAVTLLLSTQKTAILDEIDQKVLCMFVKTRSTCYKIFIDWKAIRIWYQLCYFTDRDHIVLGCFKKTTVPLHKHSHYVKTMY